MRRTEEEPINPDDGQLGRMFGGALYGALIGPVVFLVFFVVEIIVNFAFEPSFWSVGTFRFTFSIAASCVFGGAFVGFFWVFTHDRFWRIIPLLALAGGVSGAAFWVIHRPNLSLLICSATGFVGVGALVLLQTLESLGSEPSETEPVVFQSEMGPPIGCPRCGQETTNHSFCEICGRDIRENPPPLVMPDGTIKTEGRHA